MAIKVASREEWDIDGIIGEVQQPNMQVLIYFFSPAFAQYEPQRALKRAFPQAACIGASMIGGWSTRQALERGITVMSLSSDEVAEVYTAFREGVKKEPVQTARAAIRELKHKTAGRPVNPDEYLGLIFFDGLCLGELVMKEFTLEKSLNLAFVGGSAADELTFTRTFVGIDDRLSDDGLAVIIMKMNIPFFFNHFVHYIPTEKSFTVTKADTLKRIVWEIDGEPAARHYSRQIGLDIDRMDAGVFARHPLGVNIEGSVYVRSPNAIVDGLGVQFYCYIEAGTRVHLLRRGNIISYARKSLADAGEHLSGIQGVILFNCVLRYLELRELNKLNDFNNVFNRQSLIGFNTYGEELFTHHNQTLTAVFFGLPLAFGQIDPNKTKRLFHYANSKLKSLIFEIFSRNELLNVNISYLADTIRSVNNGAASPESIFADFEGLEQTLSSIVRQSNLTKDDIKKMLIAYEDNIEHTGRTDENANRQNKLILSSLGYASKIQGNLLPREREMKKVFSDHSVIWKPRDIVGGDIYWMKQFDKGAVLCVCDCTGHGTPGALLAMLVVSSLEAAVWPSNCDDTAGTIWRLDQKLAAVLNVESDSKTERGVVDIDDGCDLAVLFIAKDGSVKFSSANIPVFVCDGREVAQYKGQRIFVGEGKLKSKDDVVVHGLGAGGDNKYYISSDGLFDQKGGEAGLQFGYKAFQQIILENHREKLAVITGKVWDAFEKYRSEQPRRDDFELVAFSV